MQKTRDDVLQPGSPFSDIFGDEDILSPLETQLARHAATQLEQRYSKEQQDGIGVQEVDGRHTAAATEAQEDSSADDEEEMLYPGEEARNNAQGMGDQDPHARSDNEALEAVEFQDDRGNAEDPDQNNTLDSSDTMTLPDKLRALYKAALREDEFADPEEDQSDQDQENEREDSPLREGRAEYRGYLALLPEASQVRDRRRPHRQHPVPQPPHPNTPIVLTDQQINRLNKIAALIPEYTPYTMDSMLKGAGALVVASIVSLTGFRVAGRYAGMWVPTNPLPLVIPSAAANIIANIFVRSTRVIWAADTLEKMKLRWDKKRMPLPDDEYIRNSIKVQGVISFIAAIPWVILVFQDLPEALWAKILTILFIPLLTFVVEGSLALCALTGFFDFDNQRREDAILWKYQTLCDLRSLMTPETRALITDQMLHRASRGEAYIPSSEESLSLRKAAGIIMASLALPYSMTVGYSVYNSLVKLVAVATGPCQYSMSITGGLLDTLFMLGVSLTSLIAGSTRFFLLSKANQNLAYQAFSYNDRPMFNVNGFEVERPAFQNRRAGKFGTLGLIAICFVIGFFSVGTASGLTLKNYFCDDGVFWKLLIAFLIGFNGAFGINTGSVFNAIMSTLIDLKKYATTKLPTYKSNNRLGKSMDVMLLTASHHVALMTPDQVANKYLVPCDSGFKGTEKEATDKGLVDSQIKAKSICKDLGLFNNYAVNGAGQGLHNAVLNARKHGDGRFFTHWKGPPENAAPVNTPEELRQRNDLERQEQKTSTTQETRDTVDGIPMREYRRPAAVDSLTDLDLLEGAHTVDEFDDDGSEHSEEHNNNLL